MQRGGCGQEEWRILGADASAREGRRWSSSWKRLVGGSESRPLERWKWERGKVQV